VQEARWISSQLARDGHPGLLRGIRR
jgi:hypothetical protein